MADPAPPPEPPRPDTVPIGEPERYGPLDLWRYRKPDGRELIIYSVREDRD